ncbi:MAG: MauE/DoxX family redox-associated membrane protein [Acidobacteriaceae bacterium]
MRLGRVLMSVMYVAAGLGHFVATRVYERIMPDYLPAHHQLVLISGAAEIAGGLGVLVPRTRRAAAWGLVVLLVVVMPANIWMVQHSERYADVPLWVLWVRLPLQLPLIWWAWMYTRVERARTSGLPERHRPGLD